MNAVRASDAHPLVFNADNGRALASALRHSELFRSEAGSRAQGAPLGFADMVDRFDAALPEAGMDAAATIDRLAELALPGLQTATGPRFFAWVAGGSHPVGVAANWLASAWGQNVANPLSSPAGAACEIVTAGWLLDLLDLPRQSSVGFVTGATMASFACLAAARGEVLRRFGWDVESEGLFGAPPVRVLIGEDAHASMFAVLRYLGLGERRVVRIPTAGDGTIRASVLDKELCGSEGRPTLVILQAGQINTGAFDDFERLIPMAASRRAWVHVDGAFGLWARACNARNHLTRGIENADSWSTDGHKWLQLPCDCGYAIVRDAQAHARAMRITASYLPGNTLHRDPSHYVPELSRRARGFPTWAQISHLGRKGIAAMIDQHCHLARLMAIRIASEPGAKLMNSVVLNQAIFHFGGAAGNEAGDRSTERVIDEVVRGGVAFVAGARWRGRWVMRLSVIGAATTQADAIMAADAIVLAWRRVRGNELEAA